MTDANKLPCKGKFCKRPGLPFLPLRVAYVPNGVHGLPGKLINNPYASTLYSHLTNMTNEPHKLMLRAITEGYVYIHDPNLADSPWRCYAATRDGRFKEVIVSDSEQPDAPPVFACHRTGHNLDASLLGFESAPEATVESALAWVGYSRVWWTKKIRQRMESDTGLRETYMVVVNLQALQSGTSEQDLPQFMQYTTFRLGKTGEKLKQHVLDYQENYAKALKMAADTADHDVSRREAEADPLAALMNQQSNQHGGVVLALPDIIGLAQDTAAWRNLKTGDLAKYKITQAQFRPAIVRDIVHGIKSSMEDNGQAKLWAERYAPKLDMARMHADQVKEHAHLRKLEAAIVMASFDWRTVTMRDAFKKEAWHAYDGSNAACGLALEHDFAACVKGSGALEEEKTWWRKGYLAPKDSKDNPLWQALGAGDNSVVSKALAVTGQAGTVYHNAREGADKFKQWLAERRKKGVVRSATQDTGIIAGIVASLTPSLIAKEAESVDVIGARLRIIMCARTDIFLSPASIKLTLTKAVAMAYETTWGPPTASMTTKMISARSRTLVQDIRGGFVGGQFSDATLMEINLWLPESEAAELERAATQGLLEHGKEAKSLVGNPFKALREIVSSADAKWVGLFSAVSVWGLTSALKGLQHAYEETGKQRKHDIRAAWFGVMSGVLAVNASISEVVGKVMARRVSAEVRKTIAVNVAADVALNAAEEAAVRVIAAAAIAESAGAVLAMGAAWVQGVQSIWKGYSLIRRGDVDSGNFYMGSGTAMAISGFAGAAAIVVGSGATLAEAGASGTLTSIIMGTGSALSFIPVWGWIILAVAALAAGIYLVYEAMTHEDTPLEVWLSRCWYRNAKEYEGTPRTLYPDAKGDEIELQALQQAIYGLRVTLDWDDSWFAHKDELSVKVVMPGYGHDSDYAFALMVRGVPSGHWMTLEHAYSVFSTDTALKPPREHVASIGPVRPGEKLIPMSEVFEVTQDTTVTFGQHVAIMEGTYAINPDYEDAAMLKFEYRPDVVHHPELVMTPAPHGVDFMEVDD